MTPAGCLGNQRLRHRHCAWLKAREVQKRGRGCCGQHRYREVQQVHKGPGGHGEEPYQGSFSYWGRNPKSKKLVGTVPVSLPLWTLTRGATLVAEPGGPT